MSALPVWYVPFVIGVFGLLIGSFLNAVIHRVPNNISLMGRSACPKCDHVIRAYDNIPVLSWLFLRGKCRDCYAPISLRYPVVEAGHSLFWVLLAVYVGQEPILPLLLFFASVTVALALIDLDTLRLPDVIVLPTLVIVGLSLGLLAATTGDWAAMQRAALGAIAFPALLFPFFLIGGMGFGDVKLAPSLGALTAWFSIGSAVIGLFAGFVIGGVAGVALIVAGKVKRRTPIPFGPALLAGTWVGILWGASLTETYLRVTGLS